MPGTAKNVIPLWISTITLSVAVVLLTIVIFVRLRVTPSTVRLEQEAGFKSFEAKLTAMVSTLERNSSELADRLPRIQALESKINLQTRDRLLRCEMEEWMSLAQEWVVEARAKGIDLPDLPPLPDFPKVTP